jgi:hypothetical protein
MLTLFINRPDNITDAQRSFINDIKKFYEDSKETYVGQVMTKDRINHATNELSEKLYYMLKDAAIKNIIKDDFSHKVNYSQGTHSIEIAVESTFCAPEDIKIKIVCDFNDETF